MLFVKIPEENYIEKELKSSPQFVTKYHNILLFLVYPLPN